MYCPPEVEASYTDRDIVEEKHGNVSRKRKRDGEPGGEGDATSDESTSESEDEGDLATAALDSEIMATINAIRSKDPRVYDESVRFYTEADAGGPAVEKTKKEKPLHLQDYHRKNLLNGNVDDEDSDALPLTYNQEQEQIKTSIVREINAAAGSESEDDGDDEADGFLVAKPREKHTKPQDSLDVEVAGKDPETYLSNFMVSRAWAAPSERNLHPFESDDEEEDRKADEFEQAYNLRFEDPAKSNETLLSHARDLAAKYSVRREEANPRQKKRDAEKAKKEAEKQQRKEEKARLRKLRIEQLEEKVRRIKRAAGIKSEDILPEDWSHFVDDEWDDAKWEEEMQRRFGETYYAEEDVMSEDETSGKKRKVRKPKFEDDIDIKDLIPEFEDDEKAEFSLSEEDPSAPKGKKGRKLKEERRREAKKEAKRERRIVEQLVDDQLQLELDSSLPKRAAFQYRETSPKSFGLSARDILLAEDKQLNDFAGLKKLAAFRDPEKKRKDMKHLGKKARLRKWRLDTFGNEEGLQDRELIPAPDVEKEEEGGVDIRTKGKKKRRRTKKGKVEVGDERSEA